MSQFTIPFSLDDLFSTLPIGSVTRAEVNNIYGINHRQITPAIQMNKDSQGLTFFVRPQLNLMKDNIRNTRKLYTLLTPNAYSIPRFVRNTLDPRLGAGYIDATNRTAEKVTCSLIDEEQVFIPILTNNLISLSGWPDMVQSTFTSRPGVYQEVYSMVDGSVHNYGEFDLDATFKNIKGDPILYMFYVWILYSSYVYQGLLMPYPDYIVENEVNYNTRIYRLILDETKTRVTKIFSTGASFPISIPLNQFADFNSDKPYHEQTKDLTVRFRCMGMEMFDDRQIFDFNKTVSIFNTRMTDANINNSNTDMVKINPGMLMQFNNRGYPRINPDNYNLEWWISKNVFSSKSSKLDQTGLLPLSQQNLSYTI